MSHVRAYVGKCLGIFSIHAARSEKSLLLVSFYLSLSRSPSLSLSIAVILSIITSLFRVCDFSYSDFLSLPSNVSRHICLHSSSHFLYQTFFLFLFLLCTIWQCVLQILWVGTNNRVFSKKGTIFVKRNSFARDTLILFSAKYADLYRVENIGDINDSIRRVCFFTIGEFFI